MTQLPFMQQLDAHDNELEVRDRIAHGQYNAQGLAIAQEWLRRKEYARMTASSAMRDTREEETLSIAKEANAIARLEAAAAAQSARYAMYAAVIAAIGAIIAAKSEIYNLILKIFP